MVKVTLVQGNRILSLVLAPFCSLVSKLHKPDLPQPLIVGFSVQLCLGSNLGKYWQNQGHSNLREFFSEYTNHCTNVTSAEKSVLGHLKRRLKVVDSLNLNIYFT